MNNRVKINSSKQKVPDSHSKQMNGESLVDLIKQIAEGKPQIIVRGDEVSLEEIKFIYENTPGLNPERPFDDHIVIRFIKD